MCTAVLENIKNFYSAKGSRYSRGIMLRKKNTVRSLVFSQLFILHKLLYTHINADFCRNIMMTSKERMNTLLLKNIPLTLHSRKGCERVDVGYVWEVSWRWRETATYKPQVPLTIAALLPHSSGLLNRGPEGPSPLSGAGSHCIELTQTDWNSISNWLELTASNWLKPSVAPGYISVWHPPASCGRTHLHRIQPRLQVKVIFQHPRPDAPASCYTGASLNWRRGRRSICSKPGRDDNSWCKETCKTIHLLQQSGITPCLISVYLHYIHFSQGSPLVSANLLDCDIAVREFEPPSHL